MTGWNLPPGCEVSDIPGNRPYDEFYDKRREEIFEDTDQLKDIIYNHMDTLFDMITESKEFEDIIEKIIEKDWEDYNSGDW